MRAVLCSLAALASVVSPAVAQPRFAMTPIPRPAEPGAIPLWPAELHAYERGDHGFGIGRRGTTTMLLMDEFRLWLASSGFLGSKR